ncbi:hypothetical protein [Vibrio breoganii]|uniref:hypothetical protein n=1 Tax=Vibrio breoganii TaxID=553239 RepID=UPI000C84D686|nr:hypothetical protein [Vibrio breoganii]PML94458.1 hypothetical protein BCT64_11505 [Vibrio breoganii]PMN65767.1 hypothetical protein BCT28_06100 [Vibrio breoganii]
MKRLLTLLSTIAVIPLLVSCKTTTSVSSSEPRIITLDGVEITEDFSGQFVSWKCRDFVYDTDTLVEVGYLSEQLTAGFVLYDGGDSGELTYYERKGINHRWNWGGDNGIHYSFVIKPDGTGLFYDFSNTKPGEVIKAGQVFKCQRS